MFLFFYSEISYTMITVPTPRQSALGNAEGLKNDTCVKTVEEQQSVQPCEYQLTNFYGFCDIDQPQQLRIEERGNQLWNGYHVALGCNVDTDSKLRLDSVNTNPKLLHQLFERPSLTVPYMGKGPIPSADIESFLRVGYQTDEKKPCNVLSEVSIQVPRMDYTHYRCVQDPVHIVPAAPSCGLDSRNDVRRAMYHRRCKFVTSP